MNKHLRCLLWILVSGLWPVIVEQQDETRPDPDKPTAARAGGFSSLSSLPKVALRASGWPPVCLSVGMVPVPCTSTQRATTARIV
ncbi:hypothetical protein Cob_v006774 [Colletotrichum orbiculare MAFF 240422]|uniref:Uncharacterized protein n=1 Tax=Colletotrichum orbiculare (strain 104-T / ATCC 96160 / CBS 514.97 / LARS 414 / MAFF 240422) TaxID=1213857 RepID=A0A484FSZ3_COLOR|nr:hypothetical protein Cob_v006774 [Colletotrichum orbiculare MAFF 240422]